MHSYVGLSRRKHGERRIVEANPEVSHRGDDRRHDINNYFLVVGKGGIDGVIAACLITMVIIVLFVYV